MSGSGGQLVLAVLFAAIGCGGATEVTPREEFQIDAQVGCEQSELLPCFPYETVDDCVDLLEYERDLAEDKGCVAVYDEWTDCVRRHMRKCNGPLLLNPDECSTSEFESCVAF